MATVKGSYKKPDGSPVGGTVRFTLFPPATSTYTGEMVQYTGSIVDADLDQNGEFSVSLISDDLLEVEGEALYRVDEMIDGMSSAPWMLSVPYSNSVIDLPSSRGAVEGVEGVVEPGITIREPFPIRVSVPDIQAGDSKDWSLSFVSKDVAGVKTPMNLSGSHTALVTVSETNLTSLVTITVDTTNAATGFLIWSLTPAQTLALGAGFEGWWSHQWTSAGEVTTLVEGPLTVV